MSLLALRSCPSSGHQANRSLSSCIRRFRIIRCRSIALRTVRTTLALLMLVSVISIAPHRTPPAFAGGTTFYVSPVGAAAYADATDPTEPVTGCTSLATACSDVRAGDTVFILPGVYTRSSSYSITKPLSGATTTFRGYGTSRPIITNGVEVGSSATHVTLEQMQVGPMTNGTNFQAIKGYGANLTLRDVLFQDVDTGTVTGSVRLYADDALMEYCRFNNDGESAIHTSNEVVTIGNSGHASADNVTIRYNDFEGPGGGNWIHVASIPVDGLTIRGNTFTKIGRLETESVHVQDIGFYQTMGDTVIDGNTFTHKGARWEGPDGTRKHPFACIMLGDMKKGSGGTIAITNNVFDVDDPTLDFISVDTSDYQVWDAIRVYNNMVSNGALKLTDGSFLAAYFKNNIFGNIGAAAASKPRTIWDYNLYDEEDRTSVPTGEGAHSFVGNPAFRNADTGDFTLMGSSDAIDAGIGPQADANAPTTDLAENTRSGSSADIGAHEYVGPATGDAIAPSVSITAPAPGATVPSSVALAASASDNTGVTKVEFRVDGTLIGTDATAPFTATWNASSATAGSQHHRGARLRRRGQRHQCECLGHRIVADPDRHPLREHLGLRCGRRVAECPVPNHRQGRVGRGCRRYRVPARWDLQRANRLRCQRCRRIADHLPAPRRWRGRHHARLRGQRRPQPHLRRDRHAGRDLCVCRRCGTGARHR